LSRVSSKPPRVAEHRSVNSLTCMVGVLAAEDRSNSLRCPLPAIPTLALSLFQKNLPPGRSCASAIRPAAAQSDGVRSGSWESGRVRRRTQSSSAISWRTWLSEGRRCRVAPSSCPPWDALRMSSAHRSVTKKWKTSDSTG
jgi:hypothetical protein